MTPEEFLAKYGKKGSGSRSDFFAPTSEEPVNRGFVGNALHGAERVLGAGENVISRAALLPIAESFADPYDLEKLNRLRDSNKNIYAGDILNTIENPLKHQETDTPLTGFAKGTGRFIADVVTDPLSYVGFGELTHLGEVAARVAAHKAEKSAIPLAGKLAERIAKLSKAEKATPTLIKDVPKSLIGRPLSEQIEAGQRSFANFSLPFTDVNIPLVPGAIGKHLAKPFSAISRLGQGTRLADRLAKEFPSAYEAGNEALRKNLDLFSNHVSGNQVLKKPQLKEVKEALEKGLGEGSNHIEKALQDIHAEINRGIPARVVGSVVQPFIDTFKKYFSTASGHAQFDKMVNKFHNLVSYRERGEIEKGVDLNKQMDELAKDLSKISGKKVTREQVNALVSKATEKNKPPPKLPPRPPDSGGYAPLATGPEGPLPPTASGAPEILGKPGTTGGVEDLNSNPEVTKKLDSILKSEEIGDPEDFDDNLDKISGIVRNIVEPDDVHDDPEFWMNESFDETARQLKGNHPLLKDASPEVQQAATDLLRSMQKARKTWNSGTIEKLDASGMMGTRSFDPKWQAHEDDIGQKVERLHEAVINHLLGKKGVEEVGATLDPDATLGKVITDMHAAEKLQNSTKDISKEGNTREVMLNYLREAITPGTKSYELAQKTYKELGAKGPFNQFVFGIFKHDESIIDEMYDQTKKAMGDSFPGDEVEEQLKDYFRQERDNIVSNISLNHDTSLADQVTEHLTKSKEVKNPGDEARAFLDNLSSTEYGPTQNISELMHSLLDSVPNGTNDFTSENVIDYLLNYKNEIIGSLNEEMDMDPNKASRLFDAIISDLRGTLKGKGSFEGKGQYSVEDLIGKAGVKGNRPEDIINALLGDIEGVRPPISEEAQSETDKFLKQFYSEINPKTYGPQLPPVEGPPLKSVAARFPAHDLPPNELLDETEIQHIPEKIITAKPGQTHLSLPDYTFEKPWEMGFIDQAGNFLTRDEAEKLYGAREGDALVKSGMMAGGKDRPTTPSPEQVIQATGGAVPPGEPPVPPTTEGFPEGEVPGEPLKPSGKQEIFGKKKIPGHEGYFQYPFTQSVNPETALTWEQIKPQARGLSKALTQKLEPLFPEAFPPGWGIKGEDIGTRARGDLAQLGSHITGGTELKPKTLNSIVKRLSKFLGQPPEQIIGALEGAYADIDKVYITAADRGLMDNKVEEIAKTLNERAARQLEIEQASDVKVGPLMADKEYLAHVMTPEGRKSLVDHLLATGELPRAYTAKDMSMKLANAARRQFVEINKDVVKQWVTDGFIDKSTAKQLRSKDGLEVLDKMIEEGKLTETQAAGVVHALGIDEANALIAQGKWSGNGYKPVKEFFHTDPVYATTVRGVRGERARTAAEFYQTMIDQGIAVPDEEAPANWLTVKQAELQGFRVPPEVATNMDSWYKFINNSHEQNAFLNLYDKTQDWWKAWTLSVFPAYHIRNFVGNMWNNYLAGVLDPSVYYLAGRAQLGKDIGFTSQLGKHYTTEKLIQETKELGVIDRGFVAKDIPRTIEQELEKGNLWSPGRNNTLVKKGFEVGTHIENNARLAHYIDRLKKGYTPAEAALSVKKYLFDYSELTDFERNVMKRLFPFYAWTRKNVPLQIQHLIMEPAKFSAAFKAQNELSNATPANERYLPEWMSENFPMRVRKNKNGQYEYLLLNNWLPASDLAKVLQIHQTAANMLSPIPKEILQQMFNYDFFLKKKIENIPGEHTKFLGGHFSNRLVHGVKIIRLLNEMDKLSSEDTDFVNKITGVLSGKTYLYDEQRGFSANKVRVDDIIQSLRTALRKESVRAHPDEKELDRLRALIGEAAKEY